MLLLHAPSLVLATALALCCVVAVAGSGVTEPVDLCSSMRAVLARTLLRPSTPVLAAIPPNQ